MICKDICVPAAFMAAIQSTVFNAVCSQAKQVKASPGLLFL